MENERMKSKKSQDKSQQSGRSLTIQVLGRLFEANPGQPVARREVTDAIMKALGTEDEQVGRNMTRLAPLIRAEHVLSKARGTIRQGPKWGEPMPTRKSQPRAARAAKAAPAAKAKKPAKRAEQAAAGKPRGNRAATVKVDVKAEAQRLAKQHAAKSRAALAKQAGEAAPAPVEQATAQEQQPGA